MHWVADLRPDMPWAADLRLLPEVPWPGHSRMLVVHLVEHRRMLVNNLVVPLVENRPDFSPPPRKLSFLVVEV